MPASDSEIPTGRRHPMLADDMIFYPGGSLYAVTSRGYGHTVRMARAFASLLRSGDIVCMDGDLGAGKTAFASGIAAGLGIADIAPSPTFTILHEYGAAPSDSSGYGGDRKEETAGRDDGGCGAIRAMYHFDVYRLGGEEDFCSMGFDEYFERPGSVCVIEWADKIRGILPPAVIQILMFRTEQSAGGQDGNTGLRGREEGAAESPVADPDGLSQDRTILFYFPEGDGRIERLRDMPGLSGDLLRPGCQDSGEFVTGDGWK